MTMTCQLFIFYNTIIMSMPHMVVNILRLTKFIITVGIIMFKCVNV